MKRDRRATRPPADEEPERTPAPEREGSGEDPSESGGPRGNPAVDEEDLRHKQEERERAED